jgi:hypothetical protein
LKQRQKLLRRQNRRVEFTGSLEALSLQDYQVELLARLRPQKNGNYAVKPGRFTPSNSSAQGPSPPRQHLTGKVTGLTIGSVCHAARLVRSSPPAGCSAALCPRGDRAAFRDLVKGSGRRASRQHFDDMRRVEQRARESVRVEERQGWKHERAE